MVSFLVVLAGVSLAPSCTKDDSYDRQDLIEDLTGSLGLADEQANCLADGMEAQGIDFDAFEKKFDENSTEGEILSDSDVNKMSVILASCMPEFSGLESESTTTTG